MCWKSCSLHPPWCLWIFWKTASCSLIHQIERRALLSFVYILEKRKNKCVESCLFVCFSLNKWIASRKHDNAIANPLYSGKRALWGRRSAADLSSCNRRCSDRNSHWIPELCVDCEPGWERRQTFESSYWTLTQSQTETDFHLRHIELCGFSYCEFWTHDVLSRGQAEVHDWHRRVHTRKICGNMLWSWLSSKWSHYYQYGRVATRDTYKTSRVSSLWEAVRSFVFCMRTYLE